MRGTLHELVERASKVNPLIFALLTVSVVGMNMLANKSIDTGVDWLALDCGILLSWLTFLTMDVLTHCYGPRTATVMSYAALAINLLMAGIFFIAGNVDGVWSESFVEGSEQVINSALNHTFSGAWFVILGSSIAFAVSALANNFINWGIGLAVGRGDRFSSFALRSYVSTFLGQFIDNVVFAFIVLQTFFGWTSLQCVTCALSGAVLELLFEIFFSPIGFRISRRIGIVAPASEGVPNVG